MDIKKELIPFDREEVQRKLFEYAVKHNDAMTYQVAAMLLTFPRDQIVELLVRCVLELSAANRILNNQCIELAQNSVRPSFPK